MSPDHLWRDQWTTLSGPLSNPKSWQEPGAGKRVKEDMKDEMEDTMHNLQKVSARMTKYHCPPFA